jgi:hypothetical protein
LKCFHAARDSFFICFEIHQDMTFRREARYLFLTSFRNFLNLFFGITIDNLRIFHYF